jgi:hypothetical protein
MIARIAATAGLLAVFIIGSSAQSEQAAPAGGQQPPAPGAQQAPATPGQGRGRAGGGGGGGFRQPDPMDFASNEGFVSLFDGKTLNGWSGDQNWKVEDGAITVEPSCEKPTGTVYLVWQGGEAADFELKLEMKGTGNINGGVQYRGWIAPNPGRPAPAAGARSGTAPTTTPPPCPSGAPRGTPPDAASEAQWNMWGAQYDFDAGNRYTGQYYEQNTGRGIVAWKGQVVRTEAGKNPRLVATLGEPAVIDSYYKKDDWNELHIIAIGNQMTHILNGHVLSILIDEDAPKFRKSGKIGIEVEATGKLFTRNIALKKLD